MKPSSKQKPRLRKRRIGILAMVLLVLLTSPLWARSISQPGKSTPVARVVVQGGDTLWEIAKQHGPRNEDTRSVIFRMRQLNQLQSAMIRPGDILLVPQR